MKKIMFSLVAVAAMASCTQSDVIGLSPDENVEIRVSAGITSAVSSSTRAVVEGMINESFTKDLDVAFVRADQGDTDAYATYGATALEGTVAHTNKTLSFASAQYYLANGKNTKLIGWYPRRSGVSYTQDTRVVDFGVIDGKTDLMATTLYEGSKGTEMQSIAFNHLLTQFSIKVYAPDADAQALWGKVTAGGIKITGKKQKCTITLPEATASAGVAVAPTFEGTADLDLIKADPATPTTPITYPLTLGVAQTAAGAVLAGYAMFAPQAANGDVELQIETEKGGLQKPKVTIPAGGFLPGHAYAITLKFTSAGINPTVSVVNWVDGTPIGDIEI